MNKIKIYTIKAIFQKATEGEPYPSENLMVYRGCFTNFKELYSKFHPKTIQAYSTIISKLKKEGVYRAKQIKLFNRYNEVNDVYSEIKIELFESNEFNIKYQHFFINDEIRMFDYLID